jgi:hypothetical protein
MSVAGEAPILSDWETELKFAERLKKKIGYGTATTLWRWRKLNTVPKELEWTRAGRAVLWREKPAAAQRMLTATGAPRHEAAV